jgi:hypothetical protein
MAILSKGTDFSTGDQVTAANLDALVDNATFATGAVDDTTTALDSSSPKKIIVKDGGIGTAQLADSSSKTTGVTFAKMQHVSTAQVLGRVSASEGDVEEVGVVIGGSGDAGLLFDNDDMLDNSDTAGGSATRGATQQSIKAFVDKFKPNIVQTVKTDTASTSGTSFATLMSATITPKFENSKFKISFSVCTSSNDASYGPSFRLQRGGSDLTSFLGDTAGSRHRTTISTHYPAASTSQTVSHFTALDDTSYSGLSAITFDLDWAMLIQSTGYLNRSNTDSDSASYTRSVSQLMVEEIYQ